jgi:hypothetical protein
MRLVAARVVALAREAGWPVAGGEAGVEGLVERCRAMLLPELVGWEATAAAE